MTVLTRVIWITQTFDAIVQMISHACAIVLTLVVAERLIYWIAGGKLAAFAEKACRTLGGFIDNTQHILT